MKKTKTKKKIKKEKSAFAKASADKHYPEEYLALAIVLLLLVELGFANLTQAADWQAGANLLDMSGSAQSVAADLAFAFEPIADRVADINLFYSQASQQMAVLLDFSSMGSVYGNVAGAAISN